MISYKKCSEVLLDDVYNAFSVGFSDYIIKMDISMEGFIDRFLGPEGNQLEHSYIAYDGELPVALMLGGQQDYEGVPTLRCGTMCIHPQYRGQEISKKLFQLHRDEAEFIGCKQLFLEVIVGNDRAIAFYKKMGYIKIYDIRYFTMDSFDTLKAKENTDYSIEEVSFEVIKTMEAAIRDVHINWQNNFEYLSKLTSIKYFGIYKGGVLRGYLCASKHGKVYQLWVDPRDRGQGYGSNLLIYAIKGLGLEKVYISFPNNGSLEGFTRRIGFKEDSISQYEMYLYI